EVVGSHQKLCQVYFFFIQPVVNGLSTQIHIRSWFDEHQRSSFEFSPSHPAMSFQGKAKVHSTRQFINNIKPAIMPGTIVFRSNTTTACDQVLHPAKLKAFALLEYFIHAIPGTKRQGTPVTFSMTLPPSRAFVFLLL